MSLVRSPPWTLFGRVGINGMSSHARTDFSLKRLHILKKSFHVWKDFTYTGSHSVYGMTSCTSDEEQNPLNSTVAPNGPKNKTTAIHSHTNSRDHWEPDVMLMKQLFLLHPCIWEVFPWAYGIPMCPRVGAAQALPDTSKHMERLPEDMKSAHL